MLDTITITTPASMECTLYTPVHDLCSHTHEPQKGSYIEIRYIPFNNKGLGLRSILTFIESQKETPLDLETVVARIYTQLIETGYTEFTLSAFFILDTGITLSLFMEKHTSGF